jgi:urease gamma subunit
MPITRMDLLTAKIKHEEQMRREAVKGQIEKITASVLDLARKGQTLYKVIYTAATPIEVMADLMKGVKEVFTDCDIEYRETKTAEGNVQDRILLIAWDARQ